MKPDGKLNKFIITFGFTGLISKKIPGTIGSMAAGLICYMLPSNFILMYLIFIVLFILGLICSQKYVNAYPENKDPGFIVIDEAAAMFFCNALVLNIAGKANILLIFLFFRLFDIWKPYPINKIEKYYKKHNPGFGIMIDDILAAFFAAMFYFLIF